MTTPSGEAGEGSSSGGTTTPCTHSWSEMVIKTPATETAAGVGEKSCKNCGIKETVVIPALGNSATYWKSDEEMILVMISKNTFDCLFLDYLSKVYE